MKTMGEEIKKTLNERLDTLLEMQRQTLDFSEEERREIGYSLCVELTDCMREYIDFITMYINSLEGVVYIIKED